MMRRDSRRISYDSDRMVRQGLDPKATTAITLASRTEQIRRASERARRRHQQLLPIVNAEGHLNAEAKRRGKRARQRSRTSQGSRLQSVRNTSESMRAPGSWSADLDRNDTERTLSTNGPRPSTSGSRPGSRGSIFSTTMKPPSRGTKLSNITPKKTASLGKATVDRTVWLGGIPDAIKRDKSLIARSLETQYGAVESLQIREKSDGKS